MNYLIISLFFLLFYFLTSKSTLNCIFQKCEYFHIQKKDKLKIETFKLKQMYNPSIIKTENGYLHCARHSTCTSKNILRHLYGTFFNISNLIFYRTDRNFKNLTFIKTKRYHNIILEDPRIVMFNDLYYISCTLLKNKRDIYPILLVYDKNLNFLKSIKYTGYIENKFPRIIKNWCPFVKDKKLFIHTDSFPIWRVYLMDLQKKEQNMILQVEIHSQNFFEISKELYLRCSTSWKEYDENNYICALHSKTKGFYKSIRTIFVLIDKKSLIPVKKTPIICLDKNYTNRIQFVSGLEIHDKDNIIITYGIGDYKAVSSKIKRKYIDHLFF